MCHVTLTHECVEKIKTFFDELTMNELRYGSKREGRHLLYEHIQERLNELLEYDWDEIE